MTDDFRLLGAIQSPYDEKDFPLSAMYVLPAGVVLPDRARATGAPNPPYSQDGGKCVAFSAAFDEAILTHGGARCDADELYARCKEQDGSPNQEGTFIRVAADIRLKRGIYATSGVNAGKLLKIGSYTRPALNVVELETSIYAASQGIGGSPWVAGMWPANWMQFKGTGVLPHPSGSAGGHAFKIVEYDRLNPAGHCSKIGNTWGLSWGDSKGEAWVRTSDLLSILWEQWKTFDTAPTPSPEDIVSTPLGTPTGIARIGTDPAIRGFKTDLVMVTLPLGCDFVTYGDATVPGQGAAYRIALNGETWVLKRNATFTPLTGSAYSTVQITGTVGGANATVEWK